MTGLEALQSVQYVEAKGRRFAVVPSEEWETLVEWLGRPAGLEGDEGPSGLCSPAREAQRDRSGP